MVLHAKVPKLTRDSGWLTLLVHKSEKVGGGYSPPSPYSDALEHRT